jgi:hypothetical protein
VVSATVTGESSRATAAVTGPQQTEVAAASVMAAGEPSRVTAAVLGPQQEELTVEMSQALVPRTPSQGRRQAPSESRPAGDYEAAGAAAADYAPLGGVN